MILKIISGGQTGADRGGLDAGVALGLEIGGHCPKGRSARDGRVPEEYPLIEADVWGYPVRTELNVINSDATVIFWGPKFSLGCKSTSSFCDQHDKPYLEIPYDMGIFIAAEELSLFIEAENIAVLNVAGSREESCPGMHARVKNIVMEAIGDQDCNC